MDIVGPKKNSRKLKGNKNTWKEEEGMKKRWKDRRMSGKGMALKKGWTKGKHNSHTHCQLNHMVTQVVVVKDRVEVSLDQHLVGQLQLVLWANAALVE